MASTILTTALLALCLLSTAHSAPTDNVPIRLVTNAGSYCGGRNGIPGPVVNLQDGSALSVDYSSLDVRTDIQGIQNTKTCTLVLEVASPPGYEFEIHSPSFRGSYDLDARAGADLALSVYFPDTVNRTFDMIHSGGPIVGNYSLGIETLRIKAVRPRSPCGTNATFTFATTIQALGGIPIPEIAQGKIQHLTSRAFLKWSQCTEST